MLMREKKSDEEERKKPREREEKENNAKDNIHKYSKERTHICYFAFFQNQRKI